MRISRLMAGLFIFAVATSLVSCTSGVEGKRLDRAAEKSSKPLQVRAAPVDRREIQRNVESVGSLFALEEVTVSSEVDGKVDEVLADVGDRVDRGQPIVKVSTVELRLALEQQRALYQQALARLGMSGEPDDVKNILDAAEIKKAAADLKEAQENYNRS